jgi:exosortase/archaeosortase
MSDTDVTYLVAACAGVFSLALYVGLILAPAWSAYSRVWERVAASILSLYVLTVLVGIGVAGGLAVVYFWV